MEANELRIGNLVSVDNFTTVVESINKKGINIFLDDSKIIEVADFGLNDNNIKPIPLTEEWLLKFGFTCDTSYDYFDEDIDRNVYCGYDIDTITLIMMDGYLLPKPYYDDTAFGENFKLKHVHQLQNLYFALTGKELEIKE